MLRSTHVYCYFVPHIIALFGVQVLLPRMRTLQPSWGPSHRQLPGRLPLDLHDTAEGSQETKGSAAFRGKGLQQQTVPPRSSRDTGGSGSRRRRGQ
jgi:hypothetical protein